jgi:hypothetical protein
MEAEVLDFIDTSGNQPVVNDLPRKNSTDYDKWEKEGEELKKRDSKSAWDWGDWWNSGEAYGDRSKKVRSDDWDGPSYSTITNRATVCKAFDVSLRRERLSFTHHAEVASLPQEYRDQLLDECERNRLSQLQLIQRVKEVKSYLSQGWTDSQIKRRKILEGGGVALANMSKGDDGLSVDNALLCWAEAEGIDVKITRGTDWGNPFVLGEDGDRETVIAKYRKYLDMKDGLKHRLKSGELSGKLLVCWCCPDGCHGDVLVEKTKEANK